MEISLQQILNNVTYFFIIATILEISISSIFSIAIIKNLIEEHIIHNIKSIIQILGAILLCMNIESLRIFEDTKLKIPETIHLILSVLVLSRFADAANTMLQYLKNTVKK